MQSCGPARETFAAELGVRLTPKGAYHLRPCHLRILAAARRASSRNRPAPSRRRNGGLTAQGEPGQGSSECDEEPPGGFCHLLSTRESAPWRERPCPAIQRSLPSRANGAILPGDGNNEHRLNDMRHQRTRQNTGAGEQCVAADELAQAFIAATSQLNAVLSGRHCMALGRGD